MSSDQRASMTAVMSDVWVLSLSLSRWLDLSVIPGTLMFVIVVGPAALYWAGALQSYVAFYGAVLIGIYISNRIANRKINRARSIASLHLLTVWRRNARTLSITRLSLCVFV